MLLKIKIYFAAYIITMPPTFVGGIVKREEDGRVSKKRGGGHCHIREGVIRRGVRRVGFM